jgi:cell division protein FtsZ
MGIGFGAGENRAVEAARKAIDNPLLVATTIEGATRILVNVAGSKELTLKELNEAINIIRGNADPNVIIIHGVTLADELEDSLQITVIATGFKGRKQPAADSAGEPVKPRETDFIDINEWQNIRDRSGSRQTDFLSRRGGVYSEEDLEVPAVIRKQPKYPAADSSRAEGL